MYTSKGTIQNYLMTDIDSSFDTQINNWITTAQAYINHYTGRPDGFEGDNSATVRYYDGNGDIEIDIDECVEVTAVEILDANSSSVGYTLTSGLDNDYITLPHQSAVDGTPIYRLKLIPNSTVGAWYRGTGRIKITAKWGYGTSVPKDIEYATTVLVASIIEKGLNGGKVKAEALGDYSISYENIDDSDQALGVKRILDNYKRFII